MTTKGASLFHHSSIAVRHYQSTPRRSFSPAEVCDMCQQESGWLPCAYGICSLMPGFDQQTDHSSCPFLPFSISQLTLTLKNKFCRLLNFISQVRKLALFGVSAYMSCIHELRGMLTDCTNWKNKPDLREHKPTCLNYDCLGENVRFSLT